MRLHAFALAVLLVCSHLPTYAQGPEPATSADPPTTSEALPVRRVVLYKTGVGYFEHRGRVRDNQDVTVRFTTGQLNDVLKSLTAVDLGDGRITGISYNSNTPSERRADALRVPIGASASLRHLLDALRGARVEVTTGGAALTGRLLGIEERTVHRGGDASVTPLVSIVTDTGALRSFELTPALHLRIADRELRREVGEALDVAGASRNRDVRRMTIRTAGTGSRELFVSYVSEVPVWKTTYRLVLPDNGSPFLQGWAVVDNTVGEDWTRVQLSLVAGAPQTFIQDISRPYYTRRPVVPLPQAALLSPQTHEPGRTMAPMTEQVTVAPERAPTARRVPGAAGGVPGGVVGGVVGGLPEAPPPPPPAPPASALLRPDQPVAAGGADLGDLFEYRILEPVTIAKNESALVPILNAMVDVEKVSLWNGRLPAGRPLRAVWITNTTNLTLDGGSLSVVEADAFAGEGLIEPLAPGGRRLLSYAADHKTHVHVEPSDAGGRILRVRARNGIVTDEIQEWQGWTYSVRNDDRAARTVVVEHPARPGWTLTRGPKPAESTPAEHRFRVELQPGQHVTLDVAEARTSDTQVHLSALQPDQIKLWSAHGIPAAELERVLAPVLEARRDVETSVLQVGALETEHARIVADQQRLRENMKALRGSSEERQLLLRYTTQLRQQEDRLEVLQRELAAATERRELARRLLADRIETISFDVAASTRQGT